MFVTIIMQITQNKTAHSSETINFGEKTPYIKCVWKLT